MTNFLLLWCQSIECALIWLIFRILLSWRNQQYYCECVSQPKKRPQTKRGVPYVDAIERAKGSRFRDNISSAIRLGSEELLTTVLKVRSKRQSVISIE